MSNISEEEKIRRRSNIDMAIGLQNAFDVGVSDFMIELSERYINDEIELKDMEGLIKKHYDELEKNKK